MMGMFFNRRSLLEHRVDWLAKQRPESVMIRSGYWNVTSYYSDTSTDVIQVLQYVPRGDAGQQVVMRWTWSEHFLGDVAEHVFRETARQRLLNAEGAIESVWTA